ncbi:MAG: M20/M25/M40 family metallo-hydrolase [Planctomycetia bacterium]|nr:M20/M25/M40 family metallo-hydrolase [Planctomycetia bacterium]
MTKTTKSHRPAVASIQKTATPSEPDLDRAYKLLMALLPIPGGSCQETEVAAYVAAQLRRGGAPASAIRYDTAHRRSAFGGAIGNLVLKLPGRGPGATRLPRRLLMAHLDTVPICVGTRPVRRGGQIVSGLKDRGLGADDRSGVAVVLNTALEVLRRKRHPPLTFLFTVQEEIGLYGARCASLGLLGKPELAFNFDGGPAAKLTVGATGGYRMNIVIEGLASHAGGAPELGVSAIAIAALAIAELTQTGWHGAIHQEGGTGTSNVGVIGGGEATNVVCDKVTIRAEARSHDPAFRERIVKQITAAFDRAAQQVVSAAGRRGRVEIEGRLDYESFRLASDEPCLLAAERAVRAIGAEPIRAISNGGLDANWLSARGIPTVTLGAGQLGQHTVAEALDLAEFSQACRIALQLATEEQ